jgi:hypothetical protein
LKSEDTRLREDVMILRAATNFFVGETRPPQPLMMGFIDTMRSEGHAVESIWWVLREQGCQIAARTYRAWRGRYAAARTITDVRVLDAVRDTAWATVLDATGRERRILTPEGLYGRRKMTMLVR